MSGRDLDNRWSAYEVELPAGGKLRLQSADEVDLWETAQARYMEEYQFSKLNDLVQLGTVIQQQIVMFRLQTRLNGMEAQMDAQNVPTGHYERVELKPEEMSQTLRMLNSCSVEMRQLEKSLGIDKATRESGGQHTLAQYVKNLKAAAHERGIHIVKRTLEYEAFVNDLRVKLRLLNNGDAEDRSYHDITPEKVLAWCTDETARLEQVDKDFATQRGRMYVGKL